MYVMTATGTARYGWQERKLNPGAKGSGRDRGTKPKVQGLSRSLTYSWLGLKCHGVALRAAASPQPQRHTWSGELGEVTDWIEGEAGDAGKGPLPSRAFHPPHPGPQKHRLHTPCCGPAPSRPGNSLFQLWAWALYLAFKASSGNSLSILAFPSHHFGHLGLPQFSTLFCVYGYYVSVHPLPPGMVIYERVYTPLTSSTECSAS